MFRTAAARRPHDLAIAAEPLLRTGACSDLDISWQFATSIGASFTIDLSLIQAVADIACWCFAGGVVGYRPGLRKEI